VASDTSLVFNVLARDRASKVFRDIHRNAQSAGAGIATALGPALMPVVGVATAGIAGLGGALLGAGAAVGVFGSVFKTAFGEVKEASDKTLALQEKIGLLEERIRVANETGLGDAGKLEKAKENALNELMARYNMMPPALRNVTMAYDQMKVGWLAFVNQNKPATYAVMTGFFNLLSANVQKLQPLFDVGAAAANRLVVQLGAAAGGGGMERFVSWLSATAAPAIDSLVGIVRNFGVTLYNIFQRFDGQGQGILSWLEQVTGKWAAWSAQTEGGGLQAFGAYVDANGPGVVSLLTNIATAGMNIAQAVAPLAPISLAIAGALTAIISALPPAVITTLVSAWIAYTVAMKAYHAYVLIVGTATKVWAGVQWLLNAAMTANPVGLIVAGIIALIGVIVLVATKTQFFQTVWQYVWGFLKAVGAWFAGPFANFFVAAWNKLVGAFNAGKARVVAIINMLKVAFAVYWTVYSKIIGWIIAKGASMVSFFLKMPGRIKGALSGMFNGLWTGFKSIVNKLIGGWNRLDFTIGGGSFAGISIPSASFGTPNIPYLDVGGHVQRSGLAMIHRGETVTPAAEVDRYRGGGGVITLDLIGAEAEMKRMIRKWFNTGELP
jgi:hypothetical protein